MDEESLDNIPLPPTASAEAYNDAGLTVRALEQVSAGAIFYDQTWRAIRAANPDWSNQQVTDALTVQIRISDWNAQYQNIMADIANSRTPAEREEKINFYQPKLIAFQASGIDVGNDIAYLRETQGSSLTQEFKAGVQTFLSTLSSSVEAEYLLSPDNEANVEREPTEQEITNGITRVYDDNGMSMLASATGMPLSEEILKSDDRERVAAQSFLEAVGGYCKELQEQWETQDNELYRHRAMRELEMFGVRPSDPQYELKLQEHISMIKEIHDSMVPGGMKFVRGLSGGAIKGASKAAEVVGKTGRYTGELVQVNKADIAADLLAQRIGGQSRVKFASDSIGREFDTISVEYIGQTKPALQTLNKSVRDQMKATFDAAQETGKKVYYHFEGKPAQSVIDKLYEYSQRYGVDVVIDMTPLK